MCASEPPNDGSRVAIKEIDPIGVEARYEIIAGWANSDAVNMTYVFSAIMDRPNRRTPHK